MEVLAGVSCLKCRSCSSPEPHLHPEGQICRDGFHLRKTKLNTAEFIKLVLDTRLCKRYYVGFWQRCKDDVSAFSFLVLKESDQLAIARKVLREAKKKNKKVYLWDNDLNKKRI